MNLLNSLNISKIKLFLITFLVVSFIFLFDLKSEYFQFRFLILILLIPSTIKLLKDGTVYEYDAKPNVDTLGQFLNSVL